MSDYLRQIVFHHPAIDNHAHPLLKNDGSLDFTGAISEARGGALKDASTSLAAMRAARQLAPLYGIEEDVPEWSTVLEARRNAETEEVRWTCFQAARIQCLLLDDGLGDASACEDVRFHDRFTSSPSKRIVRIEVIAEALLRQLFDAALGGGAGSHFSVPHILSSFVSQLGPSLQTLANDPHVAGFKSVVCYRTGLAVAPDHDIRKLEVALGMVTNRYWASLAQNKNDIRLQDKPLNDFVVRSAMAVCAASGKPLQFHTGLGDSDLTLSLATPSLLQPLIRAHPTTPIVLLHAAYPFTREAGYLAAMYENVWLDFGEVWPFISGAGQREVVRQVLELCPTSKAMWSTDGHYWPETFYLGAMQGRQALYDALADCVSKHELSEGQAVDVARRLLFDNANRLYRLDLEANWETDGADH